MSKIQINDVELDGAELFNDSETFLNQLDSGEMDQIVGGLTKVSNEYAVTTTAYFPRERIHPVEPTHPVRPIYPVKPTHPVRPHRIKWKHFPFPFHFPHHPQTPVIL